MNLKRISNLALFSALFASLFAMSACNEIKTPNGEIPSEYSATATNLAGTYTGEFNSIPGKLTLSIHQNRPAVAFEFTNGSTDLLDPRCHSKIGELVSIHGDIDKNGNAKLARATFALNPGTCAGLIEGRTLALTFNKKSGVTSVQVSILRDSSLVDQNGSTEPFYPRYFVGDFSKVSL